MSYYQLEENEIIECVSNPYATALIQAANSHVAAEKQQREVRAIPTTNCAWCKGLFGGKNVQYCPKPGCRKPFLCVGSGGNDQKANTLMPNVLVFELRFNVMSSVLTMKNQTDAVPPEAFSISAFDTWAATNGKDNSDGTFGQMLKARGERKANWKSLGNRTMQLLKEGSELFHGFLKDDPDRGAADSKAFSLGDALSRYVGLYNVTSVAKEGTVGEHGGSKRKGKGKAKGRGKGAAAAAKEMQKCQSATCNKQAVLKCKTCTANSGKNPDEHPAMPWCVECHATQVGYAHHDCEKMAHKRHIDYKYQPFACPFGVLSALALNEKDAGSAAVSMETARLKVSVSRFTRADLYDKPPGRQIPPWGSWEMKLVEDKKWVQKEGTAPKKFSLTNSGREEANVANAYSSAVSKVHKRIHAPSYPCSWPLPVFAMPKVSSACGSELEIILMMDDREGR